jgi:hypothetical protein
MTKPLIQIDDEIREMTDEECAELLASGWTMEGTNEALNADADTGTSPD